MVPLPHVVNGSRRFSSAAISFGALLFILWSPVLVAGVVKQLSLPELVAYAPLIVRGTIVAQQPAVSDGEAGLIATLSEVRLREVLKGRHEGPLLIRQPGGRFGGTEQSVAGAARFRDGEDVVLFLEPAKDDPSVHLVLGMAAGKFRLERGGTGEARAVQDLDGLAAFEPPESPQGQPRLRVLGKTDVGNAESFLNEIRTLAKGRAP